MKYLEDRWNKSRYTRLHPWRSNCFERCLYCILKQSLDQYKNKVCTSIFSIKYNFQVLKYCYQYLSIFFKDKKYRIHINYQYLKIMEVSVFQFIFEIRTIRSVSILKIKIRRASINIVTWHTVILPDWNFKKWVYLALPSRLSKGDACEVRQE